MLTTDGYVWRSDVGRRAYAEGKAEGRAEGKAEALLHLLQRRGIAVPENARERITTCTDMAILDYWFDRAIDATSIDDILTA